MELSAMGFLNVFPLGENRGTKMITYCKFLDLEIFGEATIFT